MQHELELAKKNSAFYIANVEKNETLKHVERRRDKQLKKGAKTKFHKGKDHLEWVFKQNKTEDEILKKQKQKKRTAEDIGRQKRLKDAVAMNDKSFLKSIFSGTD